MGAILEQNGNRSLSTTQLQMYFEPIFNGAVAIVNHSFIYGWLD